MDAALLTMTTALLAAVLASGYEQRRDGIKTRDKLDETNSAVRELAARTTVLEASHQNLRESFTELRQDFGELRQDFGEHRRVIDKNHAEITGSLADARERLARIEGHLGIGGPPTDQGQPGG